MEKKDFVFPYKGHRLIVPKESFFIPYATYIAGEYDFLKPSKNDIVLDAGANIGDYTLLASLKAKAVVAVEPSKENLEYLKINTRGLNNVYLVEKALGQRPGVAYLAGNGVATHVDTRGSEVVVTTVDEIFDVIGVSPTLVKMDIEGAEADALLGMSKTIDHVKRLVIEIHDEQNKKECEKFLKDHGYRIRYVSRKDIAFRTLKNIMKHPYIFYKYDKINNFYAIKTIVKFPISGKTHIPSVGENPGLGLMEAWRE